MRDIVLTAFIFGMLPVILRWPYVGVLMWTWLAFMNPHRLTWGFAFSMQFSLIIAVVTLFSLLMSNEQKKVPWTRETVVLAIFIGWMVLTTFFSVYPELAWVQLEKVLKIQLMLFVTLMIMRSPERIKLLVWVMTLSIAFYGVKGGIFTMKNGGVFHVRGPTGSFIAGDNEMGLALVMTVPLLRYLQLSAKRVWVRYAMGAAMVLTALAAIGSQSRGAMLGTVAMGTFFWLKSRNKFSTTLIAGLAAVLILSVMPQQWFDRMNTIQTYDQDASATGRINAWMMALNLAKNRPLGGGFETFQPGMFAIYAPVGNEVHDVHSIYFEVLGEHGFVGLALFLLLAFMTWRSASWVIRQARGDPELRWAADLCAMVQVSLVGYASAGAFLGLAYFDYYYTLVAAVVLTKLFVMGKLAKPAQAVTAPAPRPPGTLAASRAAS